MRLTAYPCIADNANSKTEVIQGFEIFPEKFIFNYNFPILLPTFKHIRMYLLRHLIIYKLMQQKSHRGLFIVFEGLDRSGKSTQCKRLKE